MGDIGAVVTVGVTNRPDARHASAQTSVSLAVDLAAEQLQAHISGQAGTLLGGEVGDERVAFDRITLREMETEDIELSALVVHVLLTVLDTLDAGDRAVIQTDVVRLHNRLPVRMVLLQDSFLVGGLRAVQECNDVFVQRAVHLQHAPNDILETAQDTKGLVAVLVPIAPWTPVHALAPCLVETGGAGQDIPETGTQDDLAGGVLLARDVSSLKGVVLGMAD